MAQITFPKFDHSFWSQFKSTGALEFQRFADLVPNIIWMQSPQREMTFINSRWSEYTGRTFDIENPESWISSIHPDDFPRIMSKGAEVGAEDVVMFEYRIKGKDGEYRWHLSRMYAVRDDHGEVVQFIGSVTDIDEIKKAQELTRIANEGAKFLSQATTLLASSLEYEKTLKSIGDLIVPNLADWCVIDILEPGKKHPDTVVLSHADPQKLIWADKIREKYPTDWESPSGAAEVLKTGQSQMFTAISDELLRLSAKDDEHYEILKSVGMRSVIIVPIVGTQKTPIGTLSLIAAEIGRDFTASDLSISEELGRRAGLAIDRSRLYESEKAAREAAEQAKRAADQASSLKTTFLANMSHEMRTPLNALIGFNDLLRDLPFDSKEREKYHAIIERNSELLLRLIDDILDLSKVESGHLTLERIPISLPDLIAEVTSSLHLQAEAKSIKFVVKSDPTVPETVLTDPTRLKQILNNIIGNAIKFTEVGSVSVFIAKDWQNKRLHFEISDTGAGIKEEAKDQLFTAFNQGDPSTTRKFGGTGLGLALSKKLAQSLGGDLWLESSRFGEGSKFIFEIEGSVPKEKYAALFSGPRLTKNVVDPKQLDSIKVLLAEDSPDNQVLVERYLTVRGAKIDKADNGQMAVEMAASGTYDIILMDMQMPILDGFSATRNLRSAGYKKPIIALTAHAMEEDRKKCLSAGCDDFITKPVKASTLAAMIAHYVSK